MIMMSKVLLALIWSFWLIASGSVAEGTDNVTLYNPTYSTTYDRVKARGYVICGTNDEFPGFSEEVYNLSLIHI